MCVLNQYNKGGNEMKRMNRILCLATLLALLLIGFSACGGGAENGTESDTGAETDATADVSEQENVPEPGGLVIRDAYLADIVKIGVSGDGSTLTPWGRAVFGNAEVRNIIFQKLFRTDFDGNVYLEIAKDIEPVDDVTYKITIWDNIKDSVGNIFTASDVKFSIEGFAATGRAGALSKLESLEVVDDTTIIWHCPSPFGLGEMATQMSAANMVTQAAYEASADGKMSTDPVGTGAYKLKDFQVGSACTLEVDENFWMRDLPADVREGLWIYNCQNIKELEYQVILDDSARAISLERGDIDAADKIAAIDIENFDNNPDVQGVRMPQRPPIGIIFNCSDTSPLADVNLRQAVCYAIDNAGLVQSIESPTFQIYGFEPLQIDAPDDWETGRAYYDCNEATAKDLVAKSGYGGEALTLMYVEKYAAYTEAVTYLQAQLKKAGLNVELKRVDQAVNEVDRFDFNAWDIRIDEFGGGDYCPEVYVAFRSGSYPVDENDPTVNILLISDEKLDSLYDAMNTDPTEANIKAFDQYFTFDKCYGYGIVGYYLETAARADVNVALGDRAAYLVPNAFTFNN
jgi:ABC-type transport system substrate-binding protein